MPSMKQTMLATVAVPCKCEISQHSILCGTDFRPSDCARFVSAILISFEASSNCSSFIFSIKIRALRLASSSWAYLSPR